MDRCYNPNAKHFSRYGGRGIKVSKEFQDCPTFCKYMASLPGFANRKHIDRINNDKGYIRGNLRWATAKENNRNKPSIQKYTFNGKRMCLAEFIERHTKLSRTSVVRHIKMGVSLEEISKLKRGESFRYNECTKQFEIRRTRWSHIP